MFDSDLNIFYAGGSGGFYFLHCLLLNKQHFCWFPEQSKIMPHPALRLRKEDYSNIKDSNWLEYNDYLVQGNQGNPELISAEMQWAFNPEVAPGWFDQQFAAVHSKNWHINTQSWKSTEIWPNNEKTLSSCCADRKYKIFFTCNDLEQWAMLPGKKIVLFTDVATQIRLSMYKKAWIYRDAGQKIFDKTKNTLRKSEKYKQCAVSRLAFVALQQAEDSIKLQDFVELMQSDSANEQQRQFTQLWLSHHTEDLLRRCQLGK